MSGLVLHAWSCAGADPVSQTGDHVAGVGASDLSGACADLFVLARICGVPRTDWSAGAAFDYRALLRQTFGRAEGG